MYFFPVVFLFLSIWEKERRRISGLVAFVIVGSKKKKILGVARSCSIFSSMRTSTTTGLVAFVLFLLVLPKVEARTATRTPDELVCLPLVVDYEGYAVLAGLLCGAIAVGIYIWIVRREGMREAKRRSESYGGDDDVVFENFDGGMEHDALRDNNSDRRQGEESRGDVQTASAARVVLDTVGSRRDQSDSIISLEAATDPALRQSLRHHVMEDAPQPPPR
jgi:hypothetical protein